MTIGDDLGNASDFNTPPLPTVQLPGTRSDAPPNEIALMQQSIARLEETVKLVLSMQLANANPASTPALATSSIVKEEPMVEQKVESTPSEIKTELPHQSPSPTPSIQSGVAFVSAPKGPKPVPPHPFAGKPCSDRDILHNAYQDPDAFIRECEDYLLLSFPHKDKTPHANMVIHLAHYLAPPASTDWQAF